MAVPCNSFSDNNLLNSAMVISCKNPPANLSDSEIDPFVFLLLVVDMIEQLRISGGELPELADIEACDAAETLRLANCATQFMTFPPNITMAQVQSYIMAQLNGALCT